MSPAAGGFRRLRVSDVERLCSDAVAVTFEVPEHLRETFAFRPGQYLTLRMFVDGGEERRSYSFSSAPGNAALSFLVRDIPRGMMSTWLREAAAPGTPMEFTGPAGSFFLREVKRPLLFLAGGTGLAPFLSMLGQPAEHMGTYVLEPVRGYAAGLLDDPPRLAALTAACALVEAALPEREAHPALYDGLAALLELLDGAPVLQVRARTFPLCWRGHPGSRCPRPPSPP